MQLIEFNGAIVTTHDNYISIAPTTRESEINLIKQLPKPKKTFINTLSDKIKRAKHARKNARLANFY